jgi:hypothetical protein
MSIIVSPKGTNLIKKGRIIKRMEQMIELKLTLEEANMVLKGLGKLPAEESMKVIQNIVQQGNTQMPAEQPVQEDVIESKKEKNKE